MNEAFVYNFLSDLGKGSKHILGKFKPFSINPVDATGVNELKNDSKQRYNGENKTFIITTDGLKLKI